MQKNKPEDQYESLESWVDDWLTVVYEQQINVAKSWCPEWWLHAGATARLHALWRAWEDATHDSGAGMAAWFVHYADPIMRELLSADSVFHGCKDRTNGDFATRWEFGGPGRPERVQQERPAVELNPTTGALEIEAPDVEGVAYFREDLEDGTVVVVAQAEPGYALRTGHRDRDPHEGGRLPTIECELWKHACDA